MKLSILDQSPITEGKTAADALLATLELAEAADRLGFTRYWVAEHHQLASLASPSPEIMISKIADRTSSLRVGSGAVLLPHYSSYKIAETFNMLSVLHPGRIDLGIGRAPGGPPHAAMALSGNYLENVRRFPEDVRDLTGWLLNSLPCGHPLKEAEAHPLPSIPPVLWLLGTSEKSAKLAAETGIPLAFGHFMSNSDGPAAVEHYRTSFQPSHFSDDPAVIIAVSAICAESDEEAAGLAREVAVRSVIKEEQELSRKVPSTGPAKDLYNRLTPEQQEAADRKMAKDVTGSPATVKRKLSALATQYQAEELMIVTITPDYESRIRSYELLAGQFLHKGGS